METIKPITYGVGQLPWEKLTAKGKLFHALIHDGKLTPQSAITICDATSAVRRLREIRKDHPLLDEKVITKSNYCFKYFFDKDYAKQMRQYCNGLKTFDA